MKYEMELAKNIIEEADITQCDSTDGFRKFVIDIRRTVRDLDDETRQIVKAIISETRIRVRVEHGVVDTYIDLPREKEVLERMKHGISTLAIKVGYLGWIFYDSFYTEYQYETLMK